MVGIDLPELIRLKRRNNVFLSVTPFPRRDWSAWIDTIETMSFKVNLFIHILPSGLICLNWYDWNFDEMRVTELLVLQRRDWSAWIDTIETI